MKKMSTGKKTFMAVVALFFGVFAFVACGSGDDAPKAGTVTPYVEEADIIAPVRFVQPVPFDPGLASGDRLDIRADESVYLWAAFKYDESLPEEVRHDIMLARAVVINQRDLAWRVDDFHAYIIRLDGTKELIPTVSEVFPYWEWDLFQDYANAMRALRREKFDHLLEKSETHEKRRVIFRMRGH